MKRLALVPLVLLTGCHDFEGDRGVLGFSTNLVAPGAPGGWDPELGVAAGTTAVFAATRRLGLSHEEDSELGELAVSARVSGLDEVWSEGPEVAVTGDPGDDGVLRFRGERRDHFSVAFAEVARLEIAEPLLHLDPMLVKPDELLMLEGAEVTLAVAAYDAAGQPLGYAASDLVVTGAQPTDGGLKVQADRDGVVTVDLWGVRAELPVYVLQPEELSATMRIEIPLEVEGDELLLVREVGADRHGEPVVLPGGGMWLEEL